MLAADSVTGALVIYPPAAIDAMIAAFNTQTDGGDRP
jgi:hypothetical protein